ncbi:mitochondrial mRNA pseudouridine synthase RPUSD3 isoform X4 [Patagioenas fasciata]|uniref:mitochondrial mRNA pseudouridine synthase RPUSD3 isoform X4 n=1 Tax=Patagioenas fasciata TaxID=372321 RepID=UPI0032E9222D
MGTCRGVGLTCAPCPLHPTQVGAAAGPRGGAGAAGGLRGAPGRSPAGAEQTPRAARPGPPRGTEPVGTAAGAAAAPGPPCRAPCGESSRQLQRFFTTARRRGQFPATYCAVTVGVPAEAEGEIRAGLRWQQQGDTTAVVPVLYPGRHSLARKEVKSTLTRYRVLGAAGGCALLQLQPRTAFPEQLPVHLTLLLCPALGDHEHSSRVGRVLGVPFLLPPEAAPTRTQVLDEELLSRLGLSPQQLRRLPLHLHLQQLMLPRGGLLCAPLPPHFLRTLRLLGLPEHLVPAGTPPPQPAPPLPPH